MLGDGSISIFLWVRCREGMAPGRILLIHGKAEASFAHSKRFAPHDIVVHVAASMLQEQPNLAAAFGVREACFRFAIKPRGVRMPKPFNFNGSPCAERRNIAGRVL